MEWEDLDGDGNFDLITGKRYRAHNGNDPGGNDPIGLYYYKWNGGSFVKHTIAYGAPGEGKGTGIYFSVTDLTNSGCKDIVAAGKDGSQLEEVVFIYIWPGIGEISRLNQMKFFKNN